MSIELSRSRAFTIFISSHTNHELVVLRTWLDASPINWLLRTSVQNSIPMLYAYARFDKLMSIGKIKKMFPRAIVDPTTEKYAHMCAEYSQFGRFETKNKNKSSIIRSKNCEKEWQKTILATIAIKSDRGMIRWIDDPFFSVDVSNLLKRLSLCPNVLIVDGLAPYIRSRVREDLIINNRAIDTIVLNLPLMRRIDGCYFQIMNQLRDGYIADIASDGKGCTYDALNIIVITPSEVCPDLVERMDIVKVSTR